MELTRQISGRSEQEINEALAAVTAELVRIVNNDADPNTTEEDVEVWAEYDSDTDVTWVHGKIIPENELDTDDDPDNETKVAVHTLVSTEGDD